MSKVYKGYELIKEIAEGNITDKQQVYLLCAEKIKLYWEYGYLRIPASTKRENRKIDMFDIMNYEFEVEIEDQTIDIDSIEEFGEIEDRTNYENRSKINKIIRVLKHLNKEIQSIKK